MGLSVLSFSSASSGLSRDSETMERRVAGAAPAARRKPPSAACPFGMESSQCVVACLLLLFIYFCF